MDNITELKEKFDLLAGRVRKHGLRDAREVRERDLEELPDVTGELSDDGRISEALERIDAGTYGVYEGYGGEILAARLEIVPEARYSFQCKDRVEG
jgi:RNA polymerase-binding transcription factor DksA